MSVASSFSLSRGFCLRARASSGASSSSSSSRSYVASKLVFSEDGTNTGSISFRSRARKSMGAKNSCWVKLSHVDPRRLFGSPSNASLMAYMHGKVTGGLVTGNLGFAA